MFKSFRNDSMSVKYYLIHDALFYCTCNKNKRSNRRGTLLFESLSFFKLNKQL